MVCVVFKRSMARTVALKPFHYDGMIGCSERRKENGKIEREIWNQCASPDGGPNSETLLKIRATTLGIGELINGFRQDEGPAEL